MEGGHKSDLNKESRLRETNSGWEQYFAQRDPATRDEQWEAKLLEKANQWAFVEGPDEEGVEGEAEQREAPREMSYEI